MTADISQLVNRCRRGDPDAFEPLVQRFQNAGYAIALGMVHDPQDAEDLLQDAFIVAYCKLGQLREPTAFPGWFRSIVVAQCRAWLRQRNTRQRYAKELSTHAELNPMVSLGQQKDGFAQRHLWEQVFALPEPARSAALLFYLSGFTQRETAAFLQVSPSTINGRLQQARQHLRRTLTPAELEDVTMSKIDVSAEVIEEVYQIATEPVKELVDLTGVDNVVLYCGVNADIMVEAAESQELVIEGNRISMGLSAEEARASARCTRICSDEVEDFVESGPHPGEVFAGTNRRADGPETSTAQTTDLWAAYLRAKGEGVNRLVPADLYPEIGAHFMPFPEELRYGMKNAARISIVQDRAQALILPPDAYRPRLQKVFRPNANDPEWVHGPVGYVSLTVRVPADRCLTVIRADQVEVRGAQCSVHLLQCSTADIEDVHGNVCLIETPATQVRRVQGQVRQSFYSFGGMNWEDDALQAKRWHQYVCRIEDIEGNVDLDVGRMDLELARLRGKVQVTNRHGDTRFHARTWSPGTQ